MERNLRVANDSEANDARTLAEKLAASLGYSEGKKHSTYGLATPGISKQVFAIRETPMPPKTY